jgi:hypothetical protein
VTSGRAVAQNQRLPNATTSVVTVWDTPAAMSGHNPMAGMMERQVNCSD